MAVSAAILTRVPAAFLPLKPSLNSNRTNRKNRTKSEEKPPKQAVFLRKVVRVTGFEPAASCSQSRRATNCATPGYEVVGWPGRIHPNQARYHLRYTRIGGLSLLLWHGLQTGIATLCIIEEIPCKCKVRMRIDRRKFPCYTVPDCRFTRFVGGGTI